MAGSSLRATGKEVTAAWPTITTGIATRIGTFAAGATNKTGTDAAYMK
jgi:hypothetical protein